MRLINGSFRLRCLWMGVAVLAGSITAAGTAAQTPAQIDAAGAGFQGCPGAPSVAIRAAATLDAQLACAGAVQALAFLAAAGLNAPPATTIDIVAELPGELGGRAVGCYLRQTRSVLLLTLAAFESGGQWFRMPADRRLYPSAAAHEMAHAVVGCHAGVAQLPVAAHEYVVYVTLFATMDPALRQRVLAQFPGTGFSSTARINDIDHLVNPSQFGVDAWRHYLQRRNRAAFLREVIAGGVVQEWPAEGP